MELKIMLGLMGLTFVLFTLYGAFRYWKDAKKEALNEMFPEKDLEIYRTIKLNKKITIKLYDLKRDKETKELDREDRTYIRIARILNEHIIFDFNEDNLEFNVDLEDFRSEELRIPYTEILEMVTNFNLSQFRFNSKENQRKLLSSEVEFMNELKDYTDEIISIVFRNMGDHELRERMQQVLDGIAQ